LASTTSGKGGALLVQFIGQIIALHVLRMHRPAGWRGERTPRPLRWDLRHALRPRRHQRQPSHPPRPLRPAAIPRGRLGAAEGSDL